MFFATNKVYKYDFEESMNKIRYRLLITLLLFCTTFTVSANDQEIKLNGSLQDTLTSLPPIVGEQVTGEDVVSKVVVVSFFASWCPPCLAEFQHLNELVVEFEKKDLTIIAINVFEDFDGDDPDRLARFIGKTDPKFFVVKGSKAVRKTFGGVKRIPTLFIFDRSGNSVMHFIHKRGSAKTNANVDELHDTIVNALK